MESAGADRGYLILAKDEELFIEAAKETTIQNPALFTLLAPRQDVNISHAVIRYVLRTHEPVVLNDMTQAGIFTGDSYIAESRTKAIICLALLYQGAPGGVLYLENSLLTGVFTLDRLGVLKLLAVQMTYVLKLNSLLAEDTARKKNEAPLPLIEPLTEREKEVLRLIAAGMSNLEIAGELRLTVSTVKTHILNIYGKLRVNRRVQAVTRAKELRLIRLPI
jgi:DNA-binding CsgD family transcriptional regulator